MAAESDAGAAEIGPSDGGGQNGAHQGSTLVILADHPSLHRGFATVGRAIAEHVSGDPTWDVRYIGYYEPAPDWKPQGYDVLAIDGPDDARHHRVARVAGALAQVVSGSEAEARPTIVLCIGTLFDLQSVIDAVRESSITRATLRLVAYTPIDFAPIPVQFVDLATEFDVVVPYSPFAHRAMADCAKRAGEPTDWLVEPIPHGVDTEVFKPLGAAERRSVRRDLFGLSDSDVLVGYFGRNSENKRVDHVLRLAQLVRSGHYRLCIRCGQLNGHALDRDGRPGEPVAACVACGHAELQDGAQREQVHFYLHTDLQPDVAVRAVTGGRDLVRIAQTLGVRDHVRFNADIRIGLGDPAHTLAARMAACDIHVLPFDCAGWELTVLETGACGVANVITEFATPAEYASDFSRVIPPSSFVMGHDVRALIDIELAARAILDLVDRPEERERLGANGVRVASDLDWHRVGQVWHDLISRLENSLALLRRPL